MGRQHFAHPHIAIPLEPLRAHHPAERRTHMVGQLHDLRGIAHTLQRFLQRIQLAVIFLDQHQASLGVVYHARTHKGQAHLLAAAMLGPHDGGNNASHHDPPHDGDNQIQRIVYMVEAQLEPQPQKHGTGQDGDNRYQPIALSHTNQPFRRARAESRALGCRSLTAPDEQRQTRERRREPPRDP